MFDFASHNVERKYVSLMFKATNAYASWDPLRPVKVGDYGVLQRDGSFAPRGNIFDDGLAAEHSITMSTRGDDHLRMISSNNTSQITFGPDVDVSLTSIIEGHFKYRFKISKGRGAVLSMLKPCLSVINYPGRLSRLLRSSSDLKGQVIVSEVYTCRSYARLLTSQHSHEVEISLEASAPTAAALGLPLTAGVGGDIEWKTSANSGDWKCAHHEVLETMGSQDEKHPEVDDKTLCYPLFKLVSLDAKGPVSKMRGARRKEEIDWELPIAEPPWGELDDDGNEIGEQLGSLDTMDLKHEGQ
ncbi:hypothetical protein AcV7_007788 [Taiwanofungus camphoratus]|nr:hypothetical protein AcW2_006927 [Antrodia cinnamomea]KAI0951784.1 hypothetical protein AcV7_007788 [Antrodia cinnamomea]